MRLLVQRVLRASVSLDGKIKSSIGKGLLVLVGISRDDTQNDLQQMCRRLLRLRIWDGDEGKTWDQNVQQKGYEILLVSQFTLYTRMKGNKPDFHYAMPPTDAKNFYDNFVALVRQTYDSSKIFEGEFGGYMAVESVNDGPVTISLESK
eukprot:TRINITY_DN9418_c0_g1_i1.p1 TRINITY_DN9418_c0_g1~~TRINITY_DN9418_c0_g1_i1.p1  ORF type:complete len:160 (-),score=20.21 TRINITY_DN9418_c0_g1_i1:35-481(-)